MYALSEVSFYLQKFPEFFSKAWAWIFEYFQKTPSSRIINICGFPNRSAKSVDIKRNKSSSVLNITAQSKLAKVFFTRELARRLSKSQVSVFSVQPVESENLNLFEYSISRFLTSKMAKLLLKYSANYQDAQTVVKCASDENIQKLSGKNFENSHLEPINPKILDENLSEWLWMESEKLCDVRY